MEKKNKFLLLIAFIAGFSIMAMELSASRLLAPYFGTSVFIWTNIIGVVMASLSCGYYFGGKLADKTPHVELLLKIIFGAGSLFLIVPVVIRPLSDIIDLRNVGFQSSSTIIFVSSLIFVLILFSTPLFLLGMVNPFIFKLYLSNETNTVGKSTGLISMISTVGSILGTFLPTLYLIPKLGTGITIYIFALLLMILGALGFKKNKAIFLMILVFSGLILFYGKAAINTKADTIFEDESAYQYIKVKQDIIGNK